jgi:hypothetical protein
MLPLPTDREANQSDGTLPYVRHRPERTLLYQLIEKYYPVFEAQRAVEDRVLPGMACMPVLQEQKPVIKKFLTLIVRSSLKHYTYLTYQR